MAELKSVPNAPPSAPDVTTPTPATAEVQTIATKAKSGAEQKSKTSYSEFKAYKYLKRSNTYLIRVNIGGGNYIDVKLDYKFSKAAVKSVSGHVGADAPMSF